MGVTAAEMKSSIVEIGRRLRHFAGPLGVSIAAREVLATPGGAASFVLFVTDPVTGAAMARVWAMANCVCYLGLGPGAMEGLHDSCQYTDPDLVDTVVQKVKRHLVDLRTLGAGGWLPGKALDTDPRLGPCPLD
jgi:hypothetical protein